MISSTIFLVVAVATKALANPQILTTITAAPSRTLSIGFASSSSGAFATLGLSPVPPGPSPTGCSQFEILVARGTSEFGNYGIIVGDPLVSAVQSMVPGSRGYAVQYPADRSNSSVSIGAKDTVDRLVAQARECPDQKFALVGYSQGAAVMHAAAPMIPEEIRKNKVVALVMFGDPGLRAVARNGSELFPPDLNGKVFENCAHGDPVCSNNSTGASFEAHISYNSPGTTFQSDSQQFIKAAFEGNPEPPRTTGPDGTGAGMPLPTGGPNSLNSTNAALSVQESKSTSKITTLLLMSTLFFCLF